MSRFVKPTEVRLPISDGDYLIVKEKLTAGEQLEVFARLYKPAEGGGPGGVTIGKTGVAESMTLDPLQVGLSTVLGYLLDWSLTDDDGRVVSIRNQPIDVVTAALRNLEFDDHQEIVAAVQAHDARIQAARQEKKRSGGSSGSGPISRSLAVVGGGTNG
ncbi:MAG TPA: hypothetical protein VK504_30575 [Vicinamibacterales bacterium]|nr:hypothetical protein [Vicinamibacterales bacterium]